MAKNAMGDEVIDTQPRVNAMGDPISEDTAAPKPPLPFLSPDSGSVFANNFGHAVNPVPGIKSIVSDAANPKIGLGRSLGTHLIDPQIEQFSKAGDAIHGRGEFSGMTPMERFSSAAGHGAAGIIPMIGPAAANAGDQIGSGDIEGGIGSGLGLIAATAAPDIIGATGRGLRRAAEPMMEQALRIKPIDKAFSKSPGRFALDEASGVTPDAISNSARMKVADLTREAENLYGKTSATGSVNPARDIIDARILQAQKGNSTYVPPIGRGRVPELGQMRQQLTEPGPNFAGATEYPPGAITPIKYQTALGAAGPTPGAPVRTMSGGNPPDPVIAAEQHPADLLRMKREFGKDFTTWNALHPNVEMPTARGAYNALDQELDRVAPEGASLNQRISSGIPVERAAEMNELRPGLIRNLSNRVSARTGALTLGAAGMATGHPLLGAAGVILPELAGDPIVQALAARGLNAGGRILRNPVIGRTAQVAPFIDKRPDQ